MQLILGASRLQGKPTLRSSPSPPRTGCWGERGWVPAGGRATEGRDVVAGAAQPVTRSPPPAARMGGGAPPRGGAAWGGGPAGDRAGSLHAGNLPPNCAESERSGGGPVCSDEPSPPPVSTFSCGGGEMCPCFSRRIRIFPFRAVLKRHYDK